MIRIRFIFLLLFQFFGLPGFSQLSQEQLDSDVKQYTEDLRKRSVDTICVYEEYCIGCLFHSTKGEDLCLEKISFLPTYIFWKSKGKTFVTIKDACFTYSFQVTDNDTFWNYYVKNKDKIKKEELKTPQFIETVNGKKETRTLNVDHSIFFQVNLMIGDDSMIKLINNFYFTKELGINEETNINYDYNVNTLLYKLHSILQETIKQGAFKKKLDKTPRPPSTYK